MDAERTAAAHSPLSHVDHPGEHGGHDHDDDICVLETIRMFQFQAQRRPRENREVPLREKPMNQSLSSPATLDLFQPTHETLMPPADFQFPPLDT